MANPTPEEKDFLPRDAGKQRILLPFCNRGSAQWKKEERGCKKGGPYFLCKASHPKRPSSSSSSEVQIPFRFCAQRKKKRTKGKPKQGSTSDLRHPSPLSSLFLARKAHFDFPPKRAHFFSGNEEPLFSFPFLYSRCRPSFTGHWIRDWKVIWAVDWNRRDLDPSVSGQFDWERSALSLRHTWLSHKKGPNSQLSSLVWFCSCFGRCLCHLRQINVTQQQWPVLRSSLAL